MPRLTACELHERAQNTLDALRQAATTIPQEPYFDRVRDDTAQFIAEYSDAVAGLERLCAAQDIACSAFYLARAQMSEGARVSATARAAFVIAEIHYGYRPGEPFSFYNFEAVAAHLRGKEGFEQSTQLGSPQTIDGVTFAGMHGSYRDYLQFCGEDPMASSDPEAAFTNIWNFDDDPQLMQEARDSLVVSRAMLWGLVVYGYPLAAFTRPHMEEYWGFVYPLYGDSTENPTALLERLDLNMESLKEVWGNKDIKYPLSYDSSVDEVLDQWIENALAEARARNAPSELLAAIEQGYYLAEFVQGDFRPYVSTYGYLLPGTSSPPLYFRGKERTVVVADNPSPLHAAWQYPQNDPDGRIIYGLDWTRVPAGATTVFDNLPRRPTCAPCIPGGDPPVVWVNGLIRADTCRLPSGYTLIPECIEGSESE